MEFQLENGPVFTILRVSMMPGESFRAEPGAMVSMSSNIEIQSKGSGKGILGSLKAAVGGESFFASVYTAAGGPGELVLAPTFPGDILRVDLSGRTLLAQGGAYLAGNTDLELSTQGSLKAMVSGEGLFLSKISGTGVVFLNAYGAISEKQLGPGETYIVDTGHIVAFDESVSYSLRKSAKGLFSTIVSGEGLVSEYTGPGRIWIQGRNLKGFARLIASLTPNRR